MTLAAAMGAFAVVFALRLVFPAPTAGIASLFFVPVAILAVEYGVAGGILGAILALVLTQIGSVVSDYPLPLASYLPRGLGYLVVGGLTGFMAERLRTATKRMRESARHFELSGDLLFTMDFKGRLIHVNEGLERMLGWTEQEARKRTILSFVHPDDRAMSISANQRAVAGEEEVTYVNRCQTKAGAFRWLEWSSHVDHEAELIYLVASDVTDKREAERSEQESRMRFRRIFNDSFAGIALVDLEGKVIEANQTMVRMLGYEDLSELAGRNTQEQFADPATLSELRGGIERLLAGEIDSYSGELRIKQPDGGFKWVDMTMSVIRDDDGAPLYRVTQLLDIQARKEAEDKLRHLAEHDSLTGVYNRHRFEQELALEMGHGSQLARSAAVLLFDVDGFKQVNDTLGHAAGDDVIVKLGTTLRDLVRTGDVVARLGGDEFAILLRRVGVAEAERIAAKIQTEAGEAIATAIGGAVRTGLSVGIAMLDGDRSITGDELLGRADAAMYEAKRAGGGRVVLSGAVSANPR